MVILLRIDFRITKISSEDLLNLEININKFERITFDLHFCEFFNRQICKGCQPGSWAMAKFSRFTPKTTEEEMEVDGDSVKLSG